METGVRRQSRLRRQVRRAPSRDRPRALGTPSLLAVPVKYRGLVRNIWLRQFCVMKANRRCSMRFHLLVPGGRCDTVMDSPVWSASVCNSRPPFLKSPTSSFFFVSTEMVGWPAAWNASIWALMYSNRAFRSGWFVPSRVLRFACRLKPNRRSNRPTSVWLAVNPRSASAPARWRWLLPTHSSAASGSPQKAGAHARSGTAPVSQNALRCLQCRSWPNASTPPPPIPGPRFDCSDSYQPPKRMTRATPSPSWSAKADHPRLR